ncbi:hypothetical protein ACNFU2_11415 [Chryseobacterium sp. PTM-20240506]|uniref:hypothetical protein n=2 Tax=unclassified Chryseobacterium TaxID=2593645 RepID=UPI003AAE7049
MKKIKFLLLIVSVFLFFGCRQESLYVDQESQNNTSKNYVINGGEIKKDEVLWSKLSGIQTQLFGANPKNKSNDPILDGAVIMTDYAGVIEKSGTTTYTFEVNRISPSQDIENLVIRKKTDGSYSGFLIQYHLSKQEIQTFQNAAKPEDIKGKVSIYKINDLNVNSNNSNKGSGYTYSEYIGCLVVNYEVIPCVSSDHHTNPSQCELTGASAPQIIVMSVDDTHCVPSGTVPGGSNPGTSPGGSNGGGSGGGGITGGGNTTLPENLYNTFIFQNFGEAYNVCEANDVQCQENRQLNIQLQAYLLTLNPKVSMLSAYLYTFLTIKGYFKINGGDAFLTEKLNQLAGWYRDPANASMSGIEKDKFVSWALEFLIQNPDTSWEQLKTRLKDLDNALTQNPNLLVDIPCGELDDWKNVANHPIPQSIKDKLKSINSNTNWYQDEFTIQNLDLASGSNINMDLFPIRITNMPIKPGTNQKYTPSEFFDFFRKNINQFAESFTPIVNTSYGINDTALWFSNNPLGALIHIEIPGDNGTVICSGYNSQAWVFTTIQAPLHLDGLHPVSGNRLFGYFIDNNGFMYLYTRGVDRFTKPIGNATITYLTQNFAFSKADELWKGMQTKLENYINSPQNGGLANKLEPKTYRPAYAKIKNYLKNNAPISSLGCP